MRVVKVHTDASYSLAKKKGSYAFVIDFGDYVFSGGGILARRHITSSSEAESLAMCNAVFILTKMKFQVDELQIYSDSTNAIGWVEKKTYQRKSSLLIHDYFKSLKKQNKIKRFKCFHVKAHTKNQDYNSLMNDWCDKEASKWFRAIKLYRRTRND